MVRRETKKDKDENLLNFLSSKDGQMWTRITFLKVDGGRISFVVVWMFRLVEIKSSLWSRFSNKPWWSIEPAASRKLILVAAGTKWERKWGKRRTRMWSRTVLPITERSSTFWGCGCTAASQNTPDGKPPLLLLSFSASRSHSPVNVRRVPGYRESEFEAFPFPIHHLALRLPWKLPRTPRRGQNVPMRHQPTPLSVFLVSQSRLFGFVQEPLYFPLLSLGCT